MVAHRKYRLVFCSLPLVLLCFVLAIVRKPLPVSDAIVFSLVGYTNAPKSTKPFALFAISNQAAYPIRWRGDWIEIEGHTNYLARIQNRELPHQYGPMLNGGDSFLIAVGEPADVLQTSWRFSMKYSRYTFDERWLDLSRRHRLPLKVGPFVLADSRRILSPSNHITVSSAWLGKRTGLTNGSSQ